MWQEVLGGVMTQLELLLDHEPSQNYLAKIWATEAIADGDFIDWDHAYESAWTLIEDGEL